MNGRQMTQRFISQMRPESCFAIFSHLPDVCVFIKDRKRRFVLCNDALVRALGCQHEDQVLGQRDEAFSPKHLCEMYAVDDDQVLASGPPVIDKLELVRNQDGSFDWYNTTKMAIVGRDGSVIGVAGISRDIKQMNSSSTRFLAMAPVIETIMTDYARQLTMAELSAKLGLSVSQFGRQFKRRFGTTPLKYLIQVRIKSACELLTSTDFAISRIALETGFYDQSHFTHQFQRLKGMTPSRYRDGFDHRPPVGELTLEAR